MKKLALSLITMATVMAFTSPLFAGAGDYKTPAELKMKGGESKQTVYKQDMPSQSAKDLIGMAVVNEKGEKIGEITDIKMDPQLGRVNYVIVYREGMEDKEVAVPLQVCEIKPGEDKVTITATEEMMKTAPEPGNVSDEEFFYQLQGHYGINPAWQIVPRK